MLIGKGMVRSKADLIQYMKDHPDEYLEHVLGVRRSWWWMKPSYVNVHAQAARALYYDGALQLIRQKPSSNSYRLKAGVK